jgi:cytochrome c peroxidase
MEGVSRNLRERRVLLHICRQANHGFDTLTGVVSRGLVATFCAVAVSGCGSSSNEPAGLGADALAALRALSPATLPGPPPDVTNKHADDPAAAALGQRLFFDPSFSGPLLDADNNGKPPSLGVQGQTGAVACASCHVGTGGFSDTRGSHLEISLGAGWGRRRAPSLLDVGQAKLLMWDGRRDALYNQPFGPLESVVEMNSSRLYMAEQIFRAYKPDYEAIFGPLPPLDDATRFPALAATLTGCQPRLPGATPPTCDGPFHGAPGDHAEFDGLAPEDQTAVTRVVVNAGKAIAAFERRLTCGQSPFDAWMNGGAPISPAAQRGAGVFVGAGRCVSCHAGPFLSDHKFHDVGLDPVPVQRDFIDARDHGAAAGLAAAIADPLNTRGAFSDGDDGRLPAAPAPEMEGAFRTPTLRCASGRPAFMHTGQLATLADVVEFFDRGGDASGFEGGNELEPLGLTAEQKSDLVAFLESLAGPGADETYQHAP